MHNRRIGRCLPKMHCTFTYIIKSVSRPFFKKKIDKIWAELGQMQFIFSEILRGPT